MVLDQGSLTQLMILIKLFDHVDKPASIAKGIGITIQGVNYHLKILRKKGLINENNEISKEGFSFLETGLSALRDFVSENMTKIDNIVTWEAIADSDITKGDTVDIFMESGYLHADHRENKTTGIARNNASEGEVVAVTSISGIIKVELGSILICVLPPIEEVQDRPALLKQVGLHSNGKSVIAVVGEEAFYAVNGAGMSPTLEYAALDGVFEAGTRGLESVLFISSRRFHYLLSDLKELQNRYKEIAVKIKYL